MDGTSAHFNHTVTVASDGKSFSGKENGRVVQGPNPYDPNAPVLGTFTATLSATKINVNTSQLHKGPAVYVALCATRETAGLAPAVSILHCLPQACCS